MPEQMTRKIETENNYQLGLVSAKKKRKRGLGYPIPWECPIRNSSAAWVPDG